MHIAQIQFIHCEIERHGPSEGDTVYSHSLQLSVPFIFQFHYTGFSAARRKEKASSEASAEAGGPPPPSPLWNKGLSAGVAASLHHDVASDAGWQSERLGPPWKHPPSKASIIFYCGYNRGCPLRAASISIDSTAGCLLLPRQKFSNIRVIFVDLCSTAFRAKSYLWMEKKKKRSANWKCTASGCVHIPEHVSRFLICTHCIQQTLFIYLIVFIAYVTTHQRET